MLRAAFMVLAIATMLATFVAFHDQAPQHHGRILPSAAPSKRSAAARRAFRRLHRCPATGLVKGACPGYVIDHVKPLACGGADTPANMQWQTTEDAKAKDAVERKNCGG
jgi:hypothetical protein